MSHSSTAQAAQTQVPVIDVGALITGDVARHAVAERIGRALREHGFFYVINHGVDERLQWRLEELSREFFAQRVEEKLKIRMELGGRAWRGYFPVGGELTSGKPDQKEGLYFGAELSGEHPAVKAGTPLHGANLFPANLPLLRATVLEYIGAMTRLGHRLMAGISLSLGLEENYFAEHYTADPLVLFRIFHYPPSADETAWGVGEHTDYGLLTILKQDEAGGLEIKTNSGWIAAPPSEGTFVCNIGDMLEHITGGLYRSTPHRVRNRSGRGRLSFPFFFDPNFHAQLQPIPAVQGALPERYARWDGASVHDFHGTYGDYLLNKVAKVFPELRRQVADD